MKETWKSLKGIVEHGDNYEVSTFGNVRNANTGKMLKGRLDHKGYLSVVFYLNGKTKYQSIHRLVAQTFLPNPLDKPQVNHIKGREKTNNRVDNLEWCTGNENQQHAFKTGLHDERNRKGENNNLATLTEKQVIEVKKLLLKGESQYKLAEMFNVGRSCIANIQSGRTWSHLQVDGFSPFSKNTLGENNIKSKLTKEDVSRIKGLYATGEYTQKDIGKMFNVSKTSIANIIKNKTWKHVI